jgi:hypothetical protein
MVKLGEIREQHNFEPKYTFSQLQRNLPHRVESQIQDSRLYKAVRMLTEKAYPTEESDYEKRWHDFYLPLKRKGYFILVPLAIILYDKRRSDQKKSGSSCGVDEVHLREPGCS